MHESKSIFFSPSLILAFVGQSDILILGQFQACLSISHDGEELSVLNEVVLFSPMSHLASVIPCFITNAKELLCLY